MKNQILDSEYKILIPNIAEITPTEVRHNIFCIDILEKDKSLSTYVYKKKENRDADYNKLLTEISAK